MPFDPVEPELIATHFIQSFSNPSFDIFFLATTWFGHPAFWVILAAFYFWKGEERKAFSIASVILFTSALVGIAKPLVGRLRPSPDEFRVIDTNLDAFAMPSGHAATIGGILGYFWEKFTPAGKMFGLFIALIVMVSRVYLGAHFVGDVVIGALFGFVIGRILHYFEQNLPMLKKGQTKILREAGVISFVTFGIIASALFRSIALAGLLLGIFAGLFAFKLMNFDSEKTKGFRLALKLFIGFAGILIFAYLGMIYGLEPEGYFVAGLWVTLIYPILFEKIAGRRETQKPPEVKTWKKKRR